MNPARAAVASDAAAIEVLVAKDGTVERVQLLGATHLPDMMVLSSVKTWLFEPATRYGEPVRYRLRLTP
jgi:outer membrane biosynthesis protein TonB